MRCAFFFAVWILLAVPAAAQDDYATGRSAMVDLIQRRGVKNKKLLNVMRTLPRHVFMPEESRQYAYEDSPAPIGRGQTISQPYIVAYMTEVLEVSPDSKVLEIGTGSGYQAAILGKIAKSVYTIEIVEELGKRAQAQLKKMGFKNVQVKIGDGYKGWPEEAPFDRIIVTAAPPEIPQALVDQLAEGGRMIVPVGKDEQELVLITKRKGEIFKESKMPVIFVPMVKEKSQAEPPKPPAAGALQ